MTKLEIHQFSCRSDNYGVLIHEAESDLTASIDAPEASAVRAALAESGWRLTHILCTHHHMDHVEGNTDLKDQTGCEIVGPEKDRGRVPGMDRGVAEGDVFPFGAFEVKVLETPGHTSGHVTYWLPDAEIVFAGDTLFSLGCGRLFEGTPEIMWNSLQKLMKLPPETQVYCGHEYTLSNAEFALTIDPGNEALQARAQEVRNLLRARKPSLPTTLSAELAANPFLRPKSADIRKNLGLEDAPDVEVFAEIRRRKDRF